MIQQERGKSDTEFSDMAHAGAAMKHRAKFTQREVKLLNAVSSIRDKEKVQRLKLEAQKMGIRQGLYVELGLNTGLRSSDLLTLTVGDFRRRGFIVRREKKTGKETEIRVHPAIVSYVIRCTAEDRDEDLLFRSDHPWAPQNTPISRATAYRWVKEACRRAGITEPVGTHTLRKTYGYWFYIKYRDIVALMTHFNHTSEAVTLRYIGYTQGELNRQTENFLL